MIIWGISLVHFTQVLVKHVIWFIQITKSKRALLLKGNVFFLYNTKIMCSVNLIGDIFGSLNFESNDTTIIAIKTKQGITWVSLVSCWKERRTKSLYIFIIILFVPFYGLFLMHAKLQTLRRYISVKHNQGQKPKDSSIL